MNCHNGCDTKYAEEKGIPFDFRASLRFKYLLFIDIGPGFDWLLYFGQSFEKRYMLRMINLCSEAAIVLLSNRLP